MFITMGRRFITIWYHLLLVLLQASETISRVWYVFSFISIDMECRVGDSDGFKKNMANCFICFCAVIFLL
jgi:hypothetical protein